MSASDNIALVRRVYESKADPAVFQEVMDPELVWDITPGFPGGGVYYGLESVGRDFLSPLRERFESLPAVGEEYFADDDSHVFVLGHYEGETKKGTARTSGSSTSGPSATAR